MYNSSQSNSNESMDEDRQFTLSSDESLDTYFKKTKEPAKEFGSEERLFFSDSSEDNSSIPLDQPSPPKLFSNIPKAIELIYESNKVIITGHDLLKITIELFKTKLESLDRYPIRPPFEGKVIKPIKINNNTNSWLKEAKIYKQGKTLEEGNYKEKFEDYIESLREKYEVDDNNIEYL